MQSEPIATGPPIFRGLVHHVVMTVVADVFNLDIGLSLRIPAELIGAAIRRRDDEDIPRPDLLVFGLDDLAILPAAPAEGLADKAVPLLRSEFTAPPQVSVAIAGKATPLTQGEQIAVRAPTNGDKAMNIAGAPLVFVGYGVKAPERGWDDFKGLDAKGKILVMLVNDPDFEGGEGDFGGKAMTYYGRWTYKYEEGARQGAKGVLVVHETEPASYGWATVKNSNTNAMFDIVRADPAAVHPPLEGWIQRDLAAQLFAASGSSFEAMKAAAKRKDFKPVPLKAKLDVQGAVKSEVIRLTLL